MKKKQSSTPFKAEAVLDDKNDLVSQVWVDGNDELVGRALCAVAATGIMGIVREQYKSKDKIAHAAGAIIFPMFNLIHLHVIQQIREMAKDDDDFKYLLKKFSEGFAEMEPVFSDSMADAVH